MRSLRGWRCARIGADAAAGFVRRRGRVEFARRALESLRQQRRPIVHAFGDDMDHAAFALHRPIDGHQPPADHFGAEALEQFRPHHDIGDAGLVLQRHEDDARRRARALPHQHQPRHARARAVAQAGQRLGFDRAPRRQFIAQQRARMRLQRQAQACDNPRRYVRRAAWGGGGSSLLPLPLAGRGSQGLRGARDPARIN